MNNNVINPIQSVPIGTLDVNNGVPIGTLGVDNGIPIGTLGVDNGIPLGSLGSSNTDTFDANQYADSYNSQTKVIPGDPSTYYNGSYREQSNLQSRVTNPANVSEGHVLEPVSIKQEAEWWIDSNKRDMEEAAEKLIDINKEFVKGAASGEPVSFSKATIKAIADSGLALADYAKAIVDTNAFYAEGMYRIMFWR